jgi:hypothetical protein
MDCHSAINECNDDLVDLVLIHVEMPYVEKYFMESTIEITTRFHGVLLYQIVFKESPKEGLINSFKAAIRSNINAIMEKLEIKSVQVIVGFKHEDELIASASENYIRELRSPNLS